MEKFQHEFWASEEITGGIWNTGIFFRKYHWKDFWKKKNLWKQEIKLKNKSEGILSYLRNCRISGGIPGEISLSNPTKIFWRNSWSNLQRYHLVKFSKKKVSNKKLKKSWNYWNNLIMKELQEQFLKESEKVILDVYLENFERNSNKVFLRNHLRNLWRDP